MKFKPIQPAAITWQDKASFLDTPKESQHAAINSSDLIARFRALDAHETFVIGELGFGAGLNCLLLWDLFIKHAPKDAKLVIYSAEKHPLALDDLVKVLNAWPELSQKSELLAAAYPVLIDGIYPLLFENGRVRLNLMLGDANTHFKSLLVCGKAGLEADLRAWHVNAWFLGDFTASENPKLFNTLELLSATGTALAALKSIRKPRTPWAVSTAVKPEKKQAVVVGAGLAGCFMAYTLSQRGFQVQLLDSAPHVAAGASGVAKAVLYPGLSAYRSPVSTWMLHAFLFATHSYKHWLNAGIIQGELNGILNFSDKTEASILAARVNAKKASDLAGLAIHSEALFVRDAGWVDTRSLCKFLIDSASIDFQPNTTVDNLDLDASVVVLANGTGAAAFPETVDLPLELFRGQMTGIRSNEASNALKLPLCGSGHVLPAENNMHWLGASYAQDTQDSMPRPKDNLDNLAKLAALPVSHTWSNKIISAWAGVRAKTPDYLPLVGPVPDAIEFKKRFAGLAKDANRLIAKPGAYYPGLYICTGFGSRGLTSIPLAAEHLASIICGEPAWLSHEIAETVSPARFLVKQIKSSLRTKKRTL